MFQQKSCLEVFEACCLILQLRKMKYTYYRGKDLTIIFDNQQLDKTVFYDKNKKQLTFKQLPEELINQLDK